MLSFGEEVSGYDIKKWADWSIGHFYWSPSFSQVYSELKRLESHGYAISQLHNGLRGRRTYKITDAGLAAVRCWSEAAPVEPPMLKHNLLLRVWLGNVSEPKRLKEIVHEHIAYLDTMSHRVAVDSDAAALEPAWAYPRIAMQWAERYYLAERELALQLIEDIDKAAAELAEARRERGGQFPTPQPGRWRDVEKRVSAQNAVRP